MKEPDAIATLVRGGGAAFLTQASSVGLTYLLQVLLARWLGATEYGTYEYVGTIGLLLAFLSGLGISGAALRFIPAYRVQGDWSRLRGIIWGSWAQTLLASVAIACCGSLMLWGKPSHFQSVLMLGLWSVPLLAIMRLQLEMARGMKQIVLAYVPTKLFYPLLMMGGSLIWIKTQSGFSSIQALIISMITLAIVLIAQVILFLQRLPAEVKQAQPLFQFRQWILVALPLLFIDGSFLILNQTDTLMIGAFLSKEAVGIYSAAAKTAGWVHFILASVNAIAAPLFAELYSQGDRVGLQSLVSTIARWMFYPALALAIGISCFAEPMLNWFGPEFGAAKWALIALIVGQLVNVGAGSVGYLLIMTGHHNQCAWVVGSSALLNLILNGVGIPTLGILGAAIATAISMSVWNVALNRLVVKHLSIDPSITAALFSR
jgi:O-antigen/teichoic acid export membrane protein